MNDIALEKSRGSREYMCSLGLGIISIYVSLARHLAVYCDSCGA